VGVVETYHREISESVISYWKVYRKNFYGIC